MYIIKVKGKTKIPDYVQIRDENFTLLAYFRADRPEKALAKCGLESQTSTIKGIIETIPFGKMQKLQV
ncbi:MAG: fructose-6-phosphate aldolase [Bacteroidia bacterium]